MVLFSSSAIFRQTERYMYWTTGIHIVGAAAEEPPKRGSFSRNRRDETRLRGCWLRGAP